MAIVIDSSVYIETERRGLEVDAIFELVPDGEALALSAVTAAELLLGVHLGSPPPRQERRAAFIEQVLERFIMLDFDIRSARKYAELLALLRSKGNMIAPHDIMIGATALANGYDVLTDNLRDFERIPGLTVRQPAW